MGRRALRGGLVAALLAIAAVTAVVLVRSQGSSTVREAAVPPAASPPPIPTLYCEFYNFMHNATVVSFLFAVDMRASAPKVFEMSSVQPDGTRVVFDTDHRPEWTYAVIDGEQAVTSPDGATRLILFGLKPTAGGVFWIEAGIRDDTYKNLDGKCRQAYFGKLGPGASP